MASITDTKTETGREGEPNWLANPRVRQGLLSVAGTVALIGIWIVVTWTGMVTPRVLPGPEVVISTFIELTQRPFAGFTIQHHLLSSLERYAYGFLLAVAIGIPLGLLMGWYRIVDEIVSPLFEGLRFVAPIAWVPFAALWFGTGIGGPILIIFAGAFPPCLINAYRGAKMVDRRIIEAGLMLGASGRRMITEILLPGSIPSIVAGLRVSAGLGWMSLVGAELIVAGSGIGYMMVRGQSNLAPEIVISGMIAIGVIGVLIDVALRFAEARIRNRWER